MTTIYNGIPFYEQVTGYSINKKYGLLHRYIYEKEVHPIPIDFDIHHINGDIKDNRVENLQCISHSNHKKLHERELKLLKNNTSGYRGVTKIRSKWKASIDNNRKREWLGLYNTAEEAHEAYINRAQEIWGV